MAPSAVATSLSSVVPKSPKLTKHLTLLSEQDDDEYCGVTIYIPLKSEKTKSPPRSPLDRNERPARPLLRRQVSFADSNGLNLTHMKEFDTRDPPKLCNKDLTKQEYDSLKRSASVPDLSLLSIGNKDFGQLPKATLSLVREPSSDRRHAQAASLVSIRYDAFRRTLFGSVAVENRAYEKKVWLRYTADGWNTFNDIYAKYSWTRHGYRGPSTDYFSFQFNMDYGLLVPGIQLEFVVACEMGEVTYWDNNNGQNFAAEVTSAKCTNMF
eukprot:comp12361_c0_seq1/m.7241 comp12361_c0_seq1/g.7241  ORF comp12361_c0_seq1/g.7241 comp12361_c0_seq1/m.7241 type:complete len:268 (-) comp12361_c0_seq1:372-1175(-)